MKAMWQQPKEDETDNSNQMHDGVTSALCDNTHTHTQTVL